MKLFSKDTEETKKYLVPVFWEEWIQVEIEAESLIKAVRRVINIIKNNNDINMQKNKEIALFYLKKYEYTILRMKRILK